MGSKFDSESTDWGILTSISGSAGNIFEVTLMLFYLLNVKSQIIFPGRFISAGLGKGAGIRGLSSTSPSWSFFRTSKPLKAENFAGFVLIANAELTGVIGGAASFVTFRRIDHNPFWIDIGGATVGLSAGISMSLLASAHFFDDPRKVEGTPITP